MAQIVRRLAVTTTFCAFGLVLAEGVRGQTPPAQAEAAPSLSEIVVTAQRRREDLQKVPLSVTAVTADSLEKSGITSTSELLNVVPGLTINPQVKGGVPFVRGVGSQDTNAGNETAVAMYVDGAYYMDVTGILFPLNNIERVEVLKGPQGTLFGRNATGGLINVITRDPESRPALEASLGYGNYETVESSLYATGGTEHLAGNLAVYAVRQDEGFGRNLFNGHEVNKRNETALRTKLLWTPTEDDRLTLSLDWGSNKSDFGMARNVLPGSFLSGGVPLQGTPFDAGNSSVDPTVPTASAWGGYLRYEHDFHYAALTILTAVRKNKLEFRFDSDLTPPRLAEVDSKNNSVTFQTEVLLVGTKNRFDWTAGVFFLNGYSDYDPLAVRSVNPAANTNLFARGDLISVAPFGQGTYALTDSTRVTVGGRYTADKRNLRQQRLAVTGNANPPGTVLASRIDDVTYSEPTYRLALEHSFLDTVMGYASFTHGFKSGVYNLPDTVQPPVGPEKIDAFEVGLKTELAERRVRLNTAAFHYIYRDIQVQAAPTPGPGNPAGIGAQLLNAAEGTINGLEVESTLVSGFGSTNLELSMGLSVLDAEYTSFPRGTATVPNAPAVGGNSTVTSDLTGNKMIRTPKWTLNASADYGIPVGNDLLSFNVSYFHSDGYYWDPDNRTQQDAYDLINAQVAYAFGKDGRYRIRAWGKNLADKFTYSYVLASSSGDVAQAAPPRTYGLSVDFAL